MIPEVLLDTENFGDIFEEARGRIASIYPEWNDYNYHDPGITLLEMFSWLKEGQQFYLDQTGEEQKDKFLKLLGTKRLVKEPAKVFLTMDVARDVILPKGTRFYADTVCYEAIERNVILKEDITRCFYGRDRIEGYLDPNQLQFGNEIRMYMFGKEPEPGDAFYIGLNAPLLAGLRMSIYFDLFTEYEVVRNPLKKELPVPFMSYCVEYLGEYGWKKVSRLTDTTYGFLQDGQIFFEVQEEMKEGEVFGNTGYFLRIRLMEGIYDVPPVLVGLGINVLEASQTEHILEHGIVRKNDAIVESSGVIRVIADTYLSLYGENDIYLEHKGRLQEVSVSEKYLDERSGTCTFHFKLPEGCKAFEAVHLIHYEAPKKAVRILAQGNGYPKQLYQLYDECVEYETFEIMVQEEDSQVFTFWKRVEDFAQSGPEDRHFIFHSREGSVQFGDCIHGLAPEGEIRIASYVRTLGTNGKIKAGKINRMDEELHIDAVVTNHKNSTGGRREETYDESFVRVRKELRQPVTAVTYEDYERYIRETPGLMIAGCKVLKPKEVKEIFPYYDESSITVVVKPYAKQRKKELMEIYRNTIFHYLEQFRMTGTSVYLIRPVYIEVEVSVEAAVKAHYVYAEDEVKKTVQEYFKKLAAKFGACVQYSELYGAIEMLTCVKQMYALHFEARGMGVVHLADGSIKLPAHGVVELVGEEYQLTMN